MDVRKHNWNDIPNLFCDTLGMGQLMMVVSGANNQIERDLDSVHLDQVWGGADYTVLGEGKEIE